MEQARALWHISKDQSEIRSASFSNSDGDQNCKIKALYSLISTGTERLVAKGEVPPAIESQMQVPFMEGNFPFPIKYGYSLVAEVISPNHALTGKTVHLLHPHQTESAVPTTALFVVPDSVPAKRATLASNLETALNAVWDAQVSIGDRVLIVGFGIIGALLAMTLKKIAAVEITIQEIDPKRIRLAEKLGFRVNAPQETSTSFDCAFHTTASASGLQLCIDKVGFEGKVIELSWYGNKSASIQLGGDFHSLRKQIISSQVSQLPADRRGRWDYLRRKQVVFELLKDAQFDELLTATVSFNELPQFFTKLRHNPPQELVWTVAYQ